MRYEWDTKKAAINFNKHGISFEMGATVFEDPYHISILDDSSSSREERWVTLGIASDAKTVVVVHTYYVEVSEGEAIRIISARQATKSERRQYEEGI